jgi:hypothetical protein
MAIQLAAQAGRALASAAPTLVEKAKDLAPEVYSNTKNWVASKMGMKTVDLPKIASTPNGAQVVVEGLVSHGMQMDLLHQHLPVATNKEIAAYARALAEMQSSIRQRGDTIAGGIDGSASQVTAALKMRVVKENVRFAASALGASTVSDLRRKLDAIRLIDNDDLQAILVDSGESISNISLLGS